MTRPWYLSGCVDGHWRMLARNALKWSSGWRRFAIRRLWIDVWKERRQNWIRKKNRCWQLMQVTVDRNAVKSWCPKLEFTVIGLIFILLTLWQYRCSGVRLLLSSFRSFFVGFPRSPSIDQQLCPAWGAGNRGSSYSAWRIVASKKIEVTLEEREPTSWSWDKRLRPFRGDLGGMGGDQYYTLSFRRAPIVKSVENLEIQRNWDH